VLAAKIVTRASMTDIKDKYESIIPSRSYDSIDKSHAVI